MEIFKKQIELIEEKKISFINPDYFRSSFNKPKSKKEILITVDDGFDSFYQNAWPYLKKKKFHLYYLSQLKQ